MNDKTTHNNQNNASQGNSAQKKNNKRRHFHKNHNKNNNNASAPGANNPQANKRPQHSHHKQQKGDNRPAHLNIEKTYEKYLNLLDQHLIARRKYHDLFFRADPNQKTKLERNFYNTLNDLQEFQNKMTPEMKLLFEKRNNGLKEDRIYTENRQIEPIGVLEVLNEEDIEDPHYLKSQAQADYSEDTEESSGTLEDYLKYKGL